MLAAGGRSYPQCGTTGDGYRFAAALGHTIVPPVAALVPIASDAAWVRAMQGMTIADAAVKVMEGETCLAQRRGSLLFAHFGLSGPAILDVSRAVSRHPRPATLVLVCDFLPAVDEEELAVSLQRQCQTAGRNSLPTCWTSGFRIALPRPLLNSRRFPWDAARPN